MMLELRQRGYTEWVDAIDRSEPGEFFAELLNLEVTKINGHCDQYDRHQQDQEIGNEIFPFQQR
ncbi:MAG: disks large-associated family protein, partial [Bacteroidota bacterium]|nr:disks large-associated family protein [Bacteroidota bacterium]